MWYVIQTETGREEEILRLMRRSLDKKLCSRYMILKRSGRSVPADSGRFCEKLCFQDIFLWRQKKQKSCFSAEAGSKADKNSWKREV